MTERKGGKVGSDGVKRYGTNRNIVLTDGDVELLKWASDALGASQADVMRTALRAYVFNLQTVLKLK